MEQRKNQELDATDDKNELDQEGREESKFLFVSRVEIILNKKL